MYNNYKRTVMMGIGDIVVCVDDSVENNFNLYDVPRLEKNKEYVIFDVNYCACGYASVSVGQLNKYGGHRCGKCDISRKYSSWYWNILRFRKRTDINASIEEQIKECITIKEYQEL